MKYLILFSFLLALGTITYAQQNKIDSLENVLKNHKNNDTTKVDILSKLAFIYSGNNPEKGILFANQAIALINQIDSTSKRLGTAYNYKALCYTTLNKDSLAIHWYEEAIAQARKINNRLFEAVALNNLSIIYSDKSDYRKALELRLKTLEIFNDYKVAKKKYLVFWLI